MGKVSASGAAWPIAVFAHNEEDNVIRCLDSLRHPGNTHEIEVFVLANGCRDGTEKIVKDYSRLNPNVHLCSITIGDKANAWNYFIHNIAPNSDIVFFIDGDVTAEPGALRAMAEALADCSEANAVASLPASGRNRKQFARQLLTEHGLPGNLYALRGDFVRRMKEMNVHLPIGQIGEDGLVGSLVKWDLDPKQEWNKYRVIVATHPDARFRFRSLSALKPRDLRTYWRRVVRYSVRRYQNQMIGRLLKQHGISAMPKYASDMYADQLEMCRLRWRGLWTLPDWAAIHQIRAQAQALAAQSIDPLSTHIQSKITNDV